MNHEEDVFLIEKIILGDTNAENILYNKYRMIIKGYLISKGQYGNDIDDDVSEILIKVFCNIKNYDGSKSKFNSWVFNIVKNYLVDKWRSYSYKTISNTISLNDITNSFNSDTTLDLFNVDNTFEDINLIKYISTQLSKEDFNLLNLKYLQGYNYDEIAEEYNITSSTASNKVNYIKSKLKKNISI